MKKLTCVLTCALLLISLLAGCASGDTASPIAVISREDGSGTRGAFIELFGVEQKNDAGEKVDYTTDKAEITSSTAVMITTVQGNKNAIGYISLGSLDDSKVKALKIDGAEASVENIKNGTYKVSRPFNIATKGEPTGLAKDFIDFILSAQGQEVVEDAGYISQGNTGAFSGELPEGSITVGGSSSVTPVMEKLKEAYLALNTAAKIEVQQTDSTSGMSAAIEGICEIGMASRELKDSELAELTPITIAIDGIAVIVNLENTVDSLSSEQVKSIFTGETLNWSELNA
jgi:phosphate transport system substrate-binding protein